MQIDYDVGDVVVCISSDGKGGDGVDPDCPLPFIAVGGFRRVRNIEPSFEGVEFEGCYDEDWCYDARSFRKLPKASDDFTEQMRKLKPHKQKVEARCPITGQPLSVREMFESECG